MWETSFGFPHKVFIVKKTSDEVHRNIFPIVVKSGKWHRLKLWSASWELYP
jgi:hypothetical protein